MNKIFYSLLIGLISIAGNPMLVYAQDKHAIEAQQHLEQAVESGQKGDAKAAGSHTEEAK